MAAAPVTPPAPTPTPAAAAPKAINLSSKALFDLNKSTLKTEGKTAIDREILARLPEFGAIRMITVSGYADRTGSPPHNQQFSERRADAVKNYLVSKGINADRVETFGYGNTQPVWG